MRGRQLFGKISDSWDLHPLGVLLSVAERAVHLEPTEKYVPLGLRSYGLGFFAKESATGAQLLDTASTFYRVEDGDFVFSGQFAWEGAVGLAEQSESGCVVSHRYPVYRVKEEIILPRFLMCFFRSPPGRFLLRENSFGAAGRNRPLNIRRLLKEPIPVPPIDVQKKIVEAIDEKLTGINGLLRERENLLSVRRDVMYAAVTKGLNPSVKFRASGVDCIPEIPEHWKVLRNKALISEVNELSETGDEELLSVSHITGVTKRSEKTVHMFLSESNVGYKKVRSGDLVINTMWAWMGALGIARNDGIVSPAYGVYRLNKELMDSEYFDLFFRSKGYISEMTRESKGIWSSRLRLYPDAFLSLRCFLHPIEEQREIAKKLNTAEFETLIETANQKLDELRDAYISSCILSGGKLTSLSHHSDNL